ncbi:translationally-controlled tumor protein homolog [Pagrus major]|uniref:translationally-controlled tumor protein homolog n=1 Tax=Pagrus major TaxID=143350 RepID=UPI003CC8C941
MIIYKCIITQDEMFSDTFKVKLTEDGMFYEVEGRRVTRTDKIDDSLLGANASAEEASEGCEDNCVSGIDIILNHKLQETSFDKKGYTAYMKTYMKAVKAYLEEHEPDRVAGFVAAAPGALKTVLGQIKDLQFYTGESMNPDGMVGLLNYREDGVTPYMLFYKDGLAVEKC